MNVALILLALASSAAADDLFDGCRAEPAISFRASCPKVRVQYADDFGSPDEAKNRYPGMLAGIEARGAVLEDDTIELAGEPRATKRYRIAAPQAIEGRSVFATIGGRAAIASCESADAVAFRETCPRMLSELLLHGPPKSVAREAPKPTLGSRALLVPEGCRVKDANPHTAAVECVDSFFNWFFLPPGVEASPDALADKAFTGMKGLGITADSRKLVSCRLGGSPARCFRGTGKLTLLFAVGTLDERPAGAICVMSPQAEALPAVCRQALVLEESAPAK